MMPMAARARAALVVAMTISTSFCRMGMSRTCRTNLVCGCDGMLFVNRPGHLEQPGTELQAGGCGSSEIDVKTNTAVVNYESDDPAIMNELIAFADGKNGS